jgi:deazaflavin-dependent oxidoreductase (nitroreductase family)
MAGNVQHRGHEPDYKPIRRLASGFGILTHVGRRSGKVYRTPVNVFRAQNGFIVALTYSSQSEWVKNVLASGQLRT